MNINTENYEEYFLLYADNELTPAQKKIVEMFVRSNPQLQKEWDDIMSTIQTPPAIVLPGKDFLLKTPMDGFIDKHNAEERFVEYHDNELNQSQKEFVEKYVASHPQIKRGFDLIGAARVAPDPEIQFPDKELLYRRAPVVRLGFFLRIAAAALVAGLMIWFGYEKLQPSHDHPKSMATTQAPSTRIDKPDNQPQITPGISQPEQKESLKPAIKNAVIVRNRPSGSVVNQENEIHQVADVTNPNIGESDPVVHAETPRLAESIQTRQTLSANESLTEQTNRVSHVDVDITPVTQNKDTYYASLSDKDVSSNYVFTDVPVENIQRSKLGIFIKKVKRTIDRNNPINRLFNGEEE